MKPTHKKLTLRQVRVQYRDAKLFAWGANENFLDAGAILLTRLLARPPSPARDAEMNAILDSLGAE
jgi:hypothetical protein